MTGDKRDTSSDQVIPLVEETPRISKREVETGQVRVALNTEIERVIGRETLHRQNVAVERVAVDRTLSDCEEPPTIREEGDTVFIPVIEEVAVVVKRLVVREEVRLRFPTTETPFEQELSVQRQNATVERDPSIDTSPSSYPKE